MTEAEYAAVARLARIERLARRDDYDSLSAFVRVRLLAALGIAHREESDLA